MSRSWHAFKRKHKQSIMPTVLLARLVLFRYRSLRNNKAKAVVAVVIAVVVDEVKAAPVLKGTAVVTNPLLVTLHNRADKVAVVVVVVAAADVVVTAPVEAVDVGPIGFLRVGEY